MTLHILLILSFKVSMIFCNNKNNFLLLLRSLRTLNDSKTVLLQEQLRLVPTEEFFHIELLNTMNHICTSQISFNITILTSRDVKCSNSSYSLYTIFILLLAGDVELNPGPLRTNSSWSPFRRKGLHFNHLNINSILPKIDELRAIR